MSKADKAAKIRIERTYLRECRADLRALIRKHGPFGPGMDSLERIIEASRARLAALGVRTRG